MSQSSSTDPLGGARVIMLGGPSAQLGHLAGAIAGTGSPVERFDHPEALIGVSGPAIIFEAIQASTDPRARALHRLEHRLTAEHLLVSLAHPILRAPLGAFLHVQARHCTLSDCQAFGFPGFLELCIDPGTTSAGVERVADLLQAAGLPSIVVRHGSFAEKIALSYMLEGMALLGEGVPAQLIENSAREAGMRSGPLAMIDCYSLSNIDHLLHAAEASHDHSADHVPDHDHHHPHHHHDHHHPHDHEHQHDHHHVLATSHSEHQHGHDHAHHDEPSPVPMTRDAIYVLEKMAHGFNRPGLQARKGFYDYDEDEAPALWSGLKVFERRRSAMSDADIRDRLLDAQSLEARRCLALGMIGSAADADRASILGLGFPAKEGGVIARCNRDLPAFLARAASLASRFGTRFEP